LTPPTPLTDPEGFFAEAPWTLGVIGLGYVGLPLLITASERGLATIGFDLSSSRVDQLAAGRSPMGDVSDEEVQKALSSGAAFTDDAAALARADAIMICVPSPLGRNRQPDLSFIESAADTVRAVARPGQLVSLESTTYPGTTEEYLVPAVVAAGLELDTEVWVSFSPERVSPGDAPSPASIPKVVGGVTPLSGLVAAAAYGRIVGSVHLVSTARAAEMAKLLENTYRAVNIGLANEMAQLAAVLDIDFWEVIEAAATKPFGFQPFWPGPGVGGHCIPLDPQFLAWRAREARFATRFIDLAEQVNSQMPAYNAARIGDLLNRSGSPVFGADILVVGIAYKRNVADERESAALEVISELRKRGARVSVMDPLVGDAAISAHGLTPVAADDDLRHFSVAAILTDHDAVDYARIAEQVPAVFDARGVYRRLGLATDNVVPL
jgi:UDP-N-acetyl-D-glucosamine dehydrogenase